MRSACRWPCQLRWPWAAWSRLHHTLPTSPSQATSKSPTSRCALQQRHPTWSCRPACTAASCHSHSSLRGRLWRRSRWAPTSATSRCSALGMRAMAVPCFACTCLHPAAPSWWWSSPLHLLCVRCQWLCWSGPGRRLSTLQQQRQQQGSQWATCRLRWSGRWSMRVMPWMPAGCSSGHWCLTRGSRGGPWSVLCRHPKAPDTWL
mmetsp:Transcript_8339/g.22258  ORF Transcript_8339/g.22258 Transcript_8339/m.22258 type:complete len:204 (+) Transcript_8339:2874-3485(+)